MKEKIQKMVLSGIMLTSGSGIVSAMMAPSVFAKGCVRYPYTIRYTGNRSGGYTRGGRSHSTTTGNRSRTWGHSYRRR